MALVVLNDVCELPNKKRKPEGELQRATGVAKSSSSSSLGSSSLGSSSRSDTYSKVSEESGVSSKSSFKPLVRGTPDSGGRVRIAIGGA